MASNAIILMNVILAIGTVIAFIYFTNKTRARVDLTFNSKQIAKLVKRFHWYYNNILLRNRFRRLVETYSSLSAYDETEVKVKSVKLFERNIAIILLFPIGAIIATRDVSVAILVSFLGLVYYESVVEKEISSVYMKITKELSLVISSIREKYLETNSIPTAILYAQKSKFLEVPINTIYRSIIDVDGKAKLESLQRKYPIKIIKTLANVCHIVNEYGAVKREDGYDSFDKDLTVMRQECDTEYNRLLDKKLAFSRLQNLTLIGIILIPVFETYLLNQIPGTAVLLKGLYGILAHAAIILISISCYYFIGQLMRNSVVNSVDKVSWIDELSKKPKVTKFVRKLYPKNLKTKMKLQSRIDEAISSKTFRYIYTAKIIASVSAFVISLVILTFGIYSVKYNFYHNYNSLTFVRMPQTESQRNQVINMDNTFMELPRDEFDNLVNEQFQVTLHNRVKASVGGLSDNEVDNQVKRLILKYEVYHNSTFKWWFIVIAYIFGVVGWFGPEISLHFRKTLVAYESAEDVAQLQTIMIVLSETTMSAYDAVCWLERQSSIHKSVLRLCHYHYTSDPMEALTKLERSVDNTDFKRIVRKLKSSVYILSLHDAFSDMSLDKIQSMTEREMIRAKELEDRKTTAKMAALAPTISAVVGCFVGPILFLGINNLLDTFKMLQESMPK